MTFLRYRVGVQVASVQIFGHDNLWWKGTKSPNEGSGENSTSCNRWVRRALMIFRHFHHLDSVSNISAQVPIF